MREPFLSLPDAGLLAGLVQAGPVFLPPLASAAAAACLLQAAAFDLATREIPDRLSAGVAVAALVAMPFLPGPAIAAALLMASTVAGLSLLAWRHGLVGGGDVKLAAALGLWLVPDALDLFLIALSATLLLTAPLFLLARRLWGARGRPLPAPLADPGYPFALALAGAGIVLLAARADILPGGGPWT